MKRSTADKHLFRVWAPFCVNVQLKLLSGNKEQFYNMQKDDEGYFEVKVSEVPTKAKYSYVLDGKKIRPDPTSRHQPDGVHGLSEIIDPQEFKWKDTAWRAQALRDMIFYEMHIGTFTPEGTFDAVIKKIPYLKRLGITCVEIMPIAQFPGKRHWGYDGVGLYAAQNSYGGLLGFKRLVNACHLQGLAVCLDVVYNHLGPEGNYLNDFGPYFTKKYSTPWGDAINYDDAYSDHVRRFIIENALFWVGECHVDALRLDAVHGIFDNSAKHILQELNESIQDLAYEQKRKIHVIAESDLNDSRIIRSQSNGGYGLAGQWSDDFHHAVHTALTHEHAGYYEDFTGCIADIAKSIEDGVVFDGKYSKHRKRRHGNSVKDLPQHNLVVCTQNHDQVGNRAFGERLSSMISFEQEKLAAVLLLLSPQTPLIFMGQEYGEIAPFQYFVDHADKELIRLVQEGRKREFSAFGWKDIPDPKSEKTFLDSKLSWSLNKNSKHEHMLFLYQDLIALRKSKLTKVTFDRVRYDEEKKWLAVEFKGIKSKGFGFLISLSESSQDIDFPLGKKSIHKILDTSSQRYGGLLNKPLKQVNQKVCLSAFGAVVYEIQKHK